MCTSLRFTFLQYASVFFKRSCGTLLIPFMSIVLSGCGGSSSRPSMDTTSSTISSSITSSEEHSSSSVITVHYGAQADMQVGELRLPPVMPNQLYPVVIVIHGGCWVSALADYHFMDNFSQSITELGYATWNIEYRGLGAGGEWPVMFQDIGSAVDYVRTLANTYPLDINKVVVVGHSAGGHLALWAASRGKLKSDSLLYVDNPLTFRGAISLAGIANLVASTNTSCNKQAPDLIGLPTLSNDAARLYETSPVQMLPTGVRTVLISGSNDTTVPPALGTQYVNLATELGDDSKHYILPGLDHFDLIDANKTDWTLYRSSLQELFRD